MLSVTTPLDDFGWTTEQVVRITGASQRRLGYWLDKGIVGADVDEARGRGRVRLWSFSNLLDVRVAMWLRDRVSLEVVASIVHQLRDASVDEPPEELRFTVIDSGDSDHPTAVVPGTDGVASSGDVVLEVTVPWRRFVAEIREAAERDGAKKRRVRDVPQPIPLPPEPTPVPTRVSASAIRALYYEGWPAQRIVDTFPGLTAQDVRDALRSRANR